MLRYHLLRHKCNIIINIISITADIAQSAFKEKDLGFFTAWRILGCCSMDDNDAGIGCQHNFTAFQCNTRCRTDLDRMDDYALKGRCSQLISYTI
jgi:hypothetical protein